MTLTVIPVTGVPEVRVGDALDALLLEALTRQGLSLQDGDIVVVSSKVASKALGLTAPDREAAIGAETVRVVAERLTGGRLTQVVEAAAGPVMAAAGVDASNTGASADVLLLPHDPDEVCRELRAALLAGAGVHRLGVVLSDTAGRPWRSGQVDFALGAAGLDVADDLRGGVDADGRELAVTVRALADEIASAADLVKGKAGGIPAAVVRGLAHLVHGPAGLDEGLDEGFDEGREEAGARSLVRTGPGDWFALGHVEAVRSALGVPPGSDLATRIGIADVAPEAADVRIGRAVAVAVHAVESVCVDVGLDRVVVTGPDPVDVGFAAARLAVSLWAEGFYARVATADERTPQSVTVRVTPRV